MQSSAWESVDVHMGIATVQDAENTLAYVSARTSAPLMSTEWSQARAAWGSLWLDQPGPNPPTTNREEFENAYGNPRSELAWNIFMGTAPFDKTFATDCLDVFQKYSLLLVCQQAILQFKDPNFDWISLYAGATVTGTQIPRQQPMYENFQQLLVEYHRRVRETASSSASSFLRIPDYLLLSVGTGIAALQA
tara:strand:+ start:285 stop:860 length:576 start_codon:yes stop_codon:yes gene_type:complete